MSNKLPESRPLGPRACGEVSFTGHSSKGNERTVGTFVSAMRASNSEIPPVAVRAERVAEREANLQTTQELSDILQEGHAVEGLDTVWSLESEREEVEVDALTLCEEQSADALAAEGATDALEEELLEENGGFHIVRVSPITYRRSTNAAEAEL